MTITGTMAWRAGERVRAQHRQKPKRPCAEHFQQVDLEALIAEGCARGATDFRICNGLVEARFRGWHSPIGEVDPAEIRERLYAAENGVDSFELHLASGRTLTAYNLRAIDGASVVINAR